MVFRATHRAEAGRQSPISQQCLQGLLGPGAFRFLEVPNLPNLRSTPHSIGAVPGTSLRRAGRNATESPTAPPRTTAEGWPSPAAACLFPVRSVPTGVPAVRARTQLAWVLPSTVPPFPLSTGWPSVPKRAASTTPVSRAVAAGVLSAACGQPGLSSHASGTCGISTVTSTYEKRRELFQVQTERGG